MSEKKTDLLSAFNRAARPPAPAAAPRTDRTRGPRPARQEDAPSRGAGASHTPPPRKNLVYRTTRKNWERIKHLAITDDVTVQELFHTALSREFERRGLPGLED